MRLKMKRPESWVVSYEQVGAGVEHGMWAPQDRFDYLEDDAPRLKPRKGLSLFRSRNIFSPQVKWLKEEEKKE